MQEVCRKTVFFIGILSLNLAKKHNIKKISNTVFLWKSHQATVLWKFQSLLLIVNYIFLSPLKVRFEISTKLSYKIYGLMAFLQQKGV